jgi:nicotinic acid mononucleotide adenylyltransferase
MDSNLELRIKLIQSFHNSPTELVLALSGGGSLVLSDLLTVSGASRTLIEASVPYSEESLNRYIGRVPEQYCCQRTARYMAMTAFHRGIRHLRAGKMQHSFVDGMFPTRSIDVSHIDDARFYAKNVAEDMEEDDLDDYLHLIGIGCTASLATDRNKKGNYRFHIAAQTLRRTIVFSLQLLKDTRTRLEEERLLADTILNAIETTRCETLSPTLPPIRLATPLPTAATPPSTFSATFSPTFLSTSPSASPSVLSSIPPSTLPKETATVTETATDSSLCNTFGAGTTADFPIREFLPLDLKPEEVIAGKQTIGSPPLVELFFGKIQAVLWKNGTIRQFKLRNKTSAAKKEPPETYDHSQKKAKWTQAVFPGSFNPIHKGHAEMIDIAEHRLGSRVALEISIQNVDKPPLDYIELEYRLKAIETLRPEQAVWFTQTPLFEDKSDIFSGTTFVVGADTLRRFADLRFYHESTHQLHDVLRLIAFHNCRFLVFARQGHHGIESLETLNIPDMLRSLCDEIPPSVFAMNISSSDLRRNEF